MDRKIIDTKHATERYAQRYFDYGITIERVHKAIYDAMIKIIKDHNDESTTYGIYSISTGICAIIDWRRDDHHKDDNRNHAIVITLPPPKKNIKDFHTGKDDVRIIVESCLQNSIPKSKFKESKDSEYITMYEINDLTVFFEDGKMFDSGIAFCIEVE